MKRRTSSLRLLSVATLTATAMLVSGGLTPSAANAATYYTAKTGSDNNSCTSATSTSTPKLTIKSGLGCLKAGDTLSIRAGTYNETINTQSQTVPTGTSWSAPVTIAAYPGETVTLRPTSGWGVVQIIGNASRYLIFDRLIFDATYMSNVGISLNGQFQSGAGFIRFTNCETYGSPDNLFFFGGGANFNEVLNCHMHHNVVANVGTRPDGHGIYIESSDNLVAGCEIDHITGYGVHVYNGYDGQTANRNTIRNNRVYGNATANEFAGGILIGSGDGNRAYNNIVYGQPNGIIVGFKNSTNSKVYNNTVYQNSTDGIQIRASSSTAIVKNNIAYSNGTNINNYSSGGTTLASNLTTNPSFMSASAGDFTLQLGSAAINAGTTLSEVADDFKGILRPQGGSFDIGAYEYSTTQTVSSPSAPASLQVTVQ